MIYRIIFAFMGGIAEAILEDDGCWSCTAMPCLVRPLDVLYSPTRDRLLAGGSVGRRYLEAAARWLKGASRFRGRSPDPQSGTTIGSMLAGKCLRLAIPPSSGSRHETV